MFSYYKHELEEGFPKNISEVFPAIPDHLDAAVECPHPECHENSVIFFKGQAPFSPEALIGLNFRDFYLNSSIESCAVSLCRRQNLPLPHRSQDGGREKVRQHAELHVCLPLHEAVLLLPRTHVFQVRPQDRRGARQISQGGPRLLHDMRQIQ